MIKHILVPLDGSRMGESALQIAANTARRMGARVTLIHVIEKGAPAEVHGERHLREVDEAEEYLKGIAEREIFKEIATEIHVHTAEVSDVARSIADHSFELSPDLIVMTTHGKRDARQIVVGTVAQQVISRGRTPVLAVRPSDDGSSPEAAADFGSLILLPIDAEHAQEQGPSLAHEFAHAFNSRIHLVMAVPKVRDLRGSDSAAALLSPAAMRVRLEMDFEGADDYLAERAEEISKGGIPVTTECVRGEAANAIVELAERARASMIVLGTHGKAGSEAFWNESVAARVVTRTSIPVLLVPLKD